MLKIHLVQPKDTYVSPSKCLANLVFKKNYGVTTTSLIKLFQDFIIHAAKKFSELPKSPLMQFKATISPTLQRPCLFKAACYVFEDCHRASSSLFFFLFFSRLKKPSYGLYSAGQLF